MMEKLRISFISSHRLDLDANWPKPQHFWHFDSCVRGVRTEYIHHGGLSYLLPTGNQRSDRKAEAEKPDTQRRRASWL